MGRPSGERGSYSTDPIRGAATTMLSTRLAESGIACVRAGRRRGRVRGWEGTVQHEFRRDGNEQQERILNGVIAAWCWLS